MYDLGLGLPGSELGRRGGKKRWGREEETEDSGWRRWRMDIIGWLGVCSRSNVKP